MEDNKIKETNPKDSLGIKKWRQYCTVPMPPVWEAGVAMLEGARKYGRHNYRVSGVRASVYVDAAKGHIDQFWEGEDIDKDSNIHHLGKAIASLLVLRDSMMNNNWVDDRPPKSNLDNIREQLQKQVEDIIEKYPDCIDPFLNKNVEMDLDDSRGIQSKRGDVSTHIEDEKIDSRDCVIHQLEYIDNTTILDLKSVYLFVKSGEIGKTILGVSDDIGIIRGPNIKSGNINVRGQLEISFKNVSKDRQIYVSYNYGLKLPDKELNNEV